MLKPENRLKKARDFNLLMKHGHWVNGECLDLKFLSLRQPDLEQNFPKKEDPMVFEEQLKLAFAVGLKISKSAVIRNRVRRQMNEVCRLLIKDNVLRIGFYGLLIAKRNVLDKSYSEISEEIELLFYKARLLKK